MLASSNDGVDHALKQLNHVPGVPFSVRLGPQSKDPSMKKLGPTRMGIDHNKQTKQKGRATFSQQKTVRDNSAGRTTLLNMAQDYLDSLKNRRLNRTVVNLYLKKNHPEVFDAFRIDSKYISDNAGKDKQRNLRGARESFAEQSAQTATVFLRLEPIST
jgi:hypothetical protein